MKRAKPPRPVDLPPATPLPEGRVWRCPLCRGWSVTGRRVHDARCPVFRPDGGEGGRPSSANE